jgi:hypothetical protein
MKVLAQSNYHQGGTVDEKLKELVQILGIAINDTLSESERIGEAVGELSRAGYGIFLILEATIGFSKRDDDAKKNPTPPLREPKPLVDAEGNIAPKTFGGRHSQDERFLRALKIRLPKDEE